MVRVTSEAVRAEGQHGVRTNLVDDIGQDRKRLWRRGYCTLSVLIIEPLVFGDPQDVQTSGQLTGAFGGQSLRWPSLRVGGAEFATGCGDADHPGSEFAGYCHHSARQVCLVVGMGPDSEDCAQLGDVR